MDSGSKWMLGVGGTLRNHGVIVVVADVVVLASVGGGGGGAG